MGASVSRDHAKLPFGYTHAKKDHSFSTSSVTRKRLATRLLRTSDTTSVTPFPIQDGSSSVASIPELVNLQETLTLNSNNSNQSANSSSHNISNNNNFYIFHNSEAGTHSPTLVPEILQNETIKSSKVMRSSTTMQQTPSTTISTATASTTTTTAATTTRSPVTHSNTIINQSEYFSLFPTTYSAATSSNSPLGSSSLSQPAMTNLELVNASSSSCVVNDTSITTSNDITTNTALTATSPVTISSPNPTFLVSPPSSCCSFSSRHDQDYISYHPSTKSSSRTQEEQDNDMDVISSLSVSEQPAYNFFGDSSSSNSCSSSSSQGNSQHTNSSIAPSPTPTGPSLQPQQHQQQQQQHNIRALLTNQDPTSGNIYNSKSSSCHQGDYETHVSSTAIMRSDFRGHPSSKRAALSYELKGNELYKLQEEENDFDERCWGGDEHTLRLETESILDDDHEHLSPIPFSDLPSLTNIGLCSLGIVKLSSNIRFLASATCVQICCNELSRIPSEIGFLKNLTILDLSKNNLTSLPETISQLTKLVDLKLSHNQLEYLPTGIGGLTKLGALYLDNNKLESIPSQIGQIKGLVNLDLSDNPITVLPAEVGKLQFLRRLKLDRCPLVEEFSHSPLHSPPTLLELAARVIVRQGISIPSKIVPHLKDYIQSAESCSFCNGPFFDSYVKRGKMIDKNDMLIPLEYTLCQPHWNTEQERIKLLFCKRPITSPPLQPPKSSSRQNSSNSKGSETLGSPSSTPTPGSISTFTTAATTTTTTSPTPTSSVNNSSSSTSTSSRRPLSRKYDIGNRLSMLRNSSSSNASSSTTSTSSSSTSSSGVNSRPTSTYRVTSTTSNNNRTTVPSPLSSESSSTFVSGNATNNNNINNLDNLAELEPEQDENSITTTTSNSTAAININNNAIRPSPRRSLTVGILARAASKLKRPLSMARNSEPITVPAMGSAPSSTSTEPTSTE